MKSKFKKWIAKEVNLLLKLLAIFGPIAIICLIIAIILDAIDASHIYKFFVGVILIIDICIFLGIYAVRIIKAVCIGIYKLFLWSEKEK